MILDDKNIIPILIDCPNDLQLGQPLDINDIAKKLPASPSTEFIAFQQSIFTESTYLSYLKLSLSQISDVNIKDLSSDIPSFVSLLEDAESNMLLNMFNDGISYKDIIHTMTLSPTVHKLIQIADGDNCSSFIRWSTAALLTSFCFDKKSSIKT